MFNRFIPIAAVVLALAGGGVVSASVEQGKGKNKGAAHAAHIQKDKQKNKGKDDKASRGQRPANWNWTEQERARYMPLLPPDMTLEAAASGFATRGEFISALNAAAKHNLSFNELKNLIVNRGMSLGEALQRLRR